VLAIPGLDSIPVIGPGLFRHNIIVWSRAVMPSAASVSAMPTTI
jgi:hypothetical protein